MKRIITLTLTPFVFIALVMSGLLFTVPANAITNNSCGFIELTNGSHNGVGSNGDGNQLTLTSEPIPAQWCFVQISSGVWKIHHRVNGQSSSEVMQSNGSGVFLQSNDSGNDAQKWTFNNSQFFGNWLTISSMGVYTNFDTGGSVLRVANQIPNGTDANWSYFCQTC